MRYLFIIRSGIGDGEDENAPLSPGAKFEYPVVVNDRD